MPDLYTLERVTRALETTIAKHVLPPREKERKAECREYEYIPLGLDMFLKQIDVVRGLFQGGESTSFIDVGCGIGTKVALARPSFIHTYGIEITEAYADVARRLFIESGGWEASKDAGKNIICGDALTHSYAKYNVIYFYCPLMDPQLEAKLEARIVSTAPKGAYFIANNLQNSDLWHSKKVKQVWGNTIFQKV